MYPQNLQALATDMFKVKNNLAIGLKDKIKVSKHIK